MIAITIDGSADEVVSLVVSVGESFVVKDGGEEIGTNAEELSLSKLLSTAVILGLGSSGDRDTRADDGDDCVGMTEPRPSDDESVKV